VCACMRVCVEGCVGGVVKTVVYREGLEIEI